MAEKDKYTLMEAKNIVDWSKGKEILPKQMDLLITTKCNLKCKFCFFSIKKNQIAEEEELPDEFLLRAVEDGLKMGIVRWYIEGGEPLFYKRRFLEIIKLIKKYDTHGNLATNGTLFDDKIIKEIVEIGWDEITFSIDSADSKVHDSIRGVSGTFGKAVNAIKEIQKAKKLLKKDRPLICMHSVITNKNYTELDKIIKLGHELGVFNIFFSHVFKETKQYDNLKLKNDNEREFQENVKKAYELSRKLSIGTNLGEYITTVNLNNLGKIDKLLKSKVSKDRNNKLLSIACYEPFYKMILLNNGNASVCSYFCDKKVAPDSIKDKSLLEIWSGQRLGNIRKAMLNGNLPECCKKCPTTLVIHNENLRDCLKTMK